MGAGRLPFWVDLIYKSAFQKKVRTVTEARVETTLCDTLELVGAPGVPLISLAGSQRWFAVQTRTLLDLTAGACPLRFVARRNFLAGKRGSAVGGYLLVRPRAGTAIFTDLLGRVEHLDPAFDHRRSC